MNRYRYNGAGIQGLMKSYENDRTPLTLRNDLKFPDIEPVVRELKISLFPEYHNRGEDLTPAKPASIAAQLNKLGALLYEGISTAWQAYANEHPEEEIADQEIANRSDRAANYLLDSLGEIREKLKLDVAAAIKGDPAARGPAEVITCYPGFTAILIHRAAHELYKQEVPYFPRRLAEYSHSKTGIDIHPGAKIGYSFFIDHGTGVVIGETVEIGNNVRIYQGTILGAWFLPAYRIDRLRKSKSKRHPTIEDNVVIYAGATILGGRTSIGKYSLIGANAILTNKKIAEKSIVLLDSTNKIEKKENIEKLL